MIVVGVAAGAGWDGIAPKIARRCAAAGPRTELLGAAAPDSRGDGLLLALAEAGVGHATIVRTGAAALEPADVDLALRYLPDVRVLVFVGAAAEILCVAVSAAGWSGAALVVIGPVDAGALAAIEGASPPPMVIDPPDRDPDGTFAGFVAALAVRLEAGQPVDAAWREVAGELAVNAVGGE